MCASNDCSRSRDMLKTTVSLHYKRYCNVPCNTSCNAPCNIHLHMCSSIISCGSTELTAKRESSSLKKESISSSATSETGRHPKIHMPKLYIPKLHIPKLYIPKLYIPKLYIPKLCIPNYIYQNYTNIRQYCIQQKGNHIIISNI